VEAGYVEGQDVYSAASQLRSGRYLLVFFIHKPDHTALILSLSARDMDRKERDRYERK
jgi:uncharacterized DUF497 family protein